MRFTRGSDQRFLCPDWLAPLRLTHLLKAVQVEGLDVSVFQGNVNWPVVHAPVASGGGGKEFAIIRSSRGGTTPSTMSLVDTNFITNINGATAAGMIAGPYHVGRVDLFITPGTGETPEDEIDHWMAIAGNFIKPGYLLPMLDLEAQYANLLTKAKLMEWINRFADALMNRKGTRFMIYCSKSTAVNGFDATISRFPLWLAAPSGTANYVAGDPAPTGAYPNPYGQWDPTGTASPKPWAFWQWAIPSVNAADCVCPGIPNPVDRDVAHGDVNFVKTMMVPGMIWTGATSADWAVAGNFSANALPTATDDLIFDTPIPATGGVITVGGGRVAHMLRFEDDYTLTAGNVAVQGGRIIVAKGKTVKLKVKLAGASGFIKSGLGTLEMDSDRTLSGDRVVIEGTLVNHGHLWVDDTGSANFTQRGGIIIVDQNGMLMIAETPGTSGTFTTFRGSLTAKRAHVHAGGVLNINGGAIDITEGIGNFGEINLIDGSLTTRQQQIIPGAARFMQSGGVHVTDSIIVADYNGGGTYQLDGGNFTVNSFFFIGYSGLAAPAPSFFRQTAGVCIINNTTGAMHPLALGVMPNDVGTISLSGSASFTVNGNVALGGINTYTGGSGILNIPAGLMTISGTLKMFDTASTAVNLVGGSLSVGALDTSGNPARFLGNGSSTGWLAGTFTFSASDLILGNGAPLGSSLTLSPAMTLNVTLAERIGNAPGDVATFTQNGSNHTIGGILFIGAVPGSTGTYTLNNGDLYAHDMIVGMGGTGDFIQNGGDYHKTGGAMRLGVDGGHGRYELRGGVLNDPTIIVGHDGDGEFEQTGGVANVETLIIGPRGRVDLRGGVFNVHTIIIEDGGLLVRRGGELNVMNEVRRTSDAQGASDALRGLAIVA